jgi:hypothetical protein
MCVCVCVWCVCVCEGARGDSGRVNGPGAAEGLIWNSLHWRRRTFQFREEINQRQLHRPRVTGVTSHDTDLLMSSAVIRTSASFCH